MKIVVVGATGLVGREVMQVLGESTLKNAEIIPAASEKSVGKKVPYLDGKPEIVGVEEALGMKPDLAIFSAGSDVSLNWAKKFAETGCRVIDNSSAWRMDPDVPLIIPEINMGTVMNEDHIIANPNCSTIQLLMVLFPLHKAFGLKRVILSTYQSVTGSGQKAVDQLVSERNDEPLKSRFYPHRIDQNCIPHCDDFEGNGYTKEEMKLVNESRKILGLSGLKVTATAVRVPVMGGHGESVYAEFEKDFMLPEVKDKLEAFQGVRVMDNTMKSIYPTPLFAKGKDEVFVGRIRKDLGVKATINFWIVADNLRKGAATNAVQIAERMIG